MFNMKSIGIITAVIAMLFSPFSAWLIYRGQAPSGEYENKDDQEKADNICIELYVTSTGEKVKLDFEEYICGVLLAEVPQYFEDEAIKAVCVAARTYCYRRINSDEKYTKHFSADVCDDYTHCLGYISLDEAKVKWGEENAVKYYEKMKKAVNETKGEILYYQENVADTVFHASSCGYTESAENIWGYNVPYLLSVETPEKVSISHAEYTADEFKIILESEGISCLFNETAENWIGEINKDKNGRVETVEICSRIITGRRMREIFGLKSTCFDLVYTDQKFKFEVKGSGHGVGLSQYGCQEYAVKGKDHKYILSHYYPGTTIGTY